MFGGKETARVAVSDANGIDGRQLRLPPQLSSTLSVAMTLRVTAKDENGCSLARPLLE
jgi:hypothetical protein